MYPFKFNQLGMIQRVGCYPEIIIHGLKNRMNPTGKL